MASLAAPLQAQEVPAAQAENYNVWANINPEDIPDIQSTEPSKSEQLQFLWEYIKFQAELAKIHICEHKKAYIIGTLAALGIITAVCTTRSQKPS